MFRNLDAEQARLKLTDQKVADKLGISRVSYVNKKKTGKFTTLEIKCLWKLKPYVNFLVASSTTCLIPKKNRFSKMCRRK